MDARRTKVHCITIPCQHPQVTCQSGDVAACCTHSLTYSKPQHAAPNDQLRQAVGARLQPRPQEEEAAR